MDPDHAHRGRRWIRFWQEVAHLLHGMDQLEGMAGRSQEPDALAHSELSTSAHAPNAATVGGKFSLEIVKIVRFLNLVHGVVEPVARGIAQDKRMVVVLVPAFEIDAVRLASHLEEPEYLGVVRRGKLEVGYPDVDV